MQFVPKGSAQDLLDWSEAIIGEAHDLRDRIQSLIDGDEYEPSSEDGSIPGSMEGCVDVFAINFASHLRHMKTAAGIYDYSKELEEADEG